MTNNAKPIPRGRATAILTRFAIPLLQRAGFTIEIENRGDDHYLLDVKLNGQGDNDDKPIQSGPHGAVGDVGCFAPHRPDHHGISCPGDMRKPRNRAR